MKIIFDSKRIEHKDPFGCLRQDELCSLSLYVPKEYAARAVYVCIENHHGYYAEYPMMCCILEGEYNHYLGGFSLAYCDLYAYYFRIVTKFSVMRVYRSGYNETSIDEGQKWQLTCYDKSYDTPPFYKGCVMYQIFPDRFNKEEVCDLTNKLQPYRIHDNVKDTPDYLPNNHGEIMNNDFYGGNLKGIQSKLVYLKSLHVSVIYLNPIFMAYSNHRYDTADYKRIDPMLGTEQDFIDLCAAAHELGMKIILDGVFSHTGSNSVYFDKNNVFGSGAYHHADSPYRTWYQFDEYPDRYTCWWGVQTLPCVNEMDRSYMDYILNHDDSVIRYWMRLGADGIRLDVADELPDEFILQLKQIVTEIKHDAIVIGEVWEDASNKESYGIKRKYFTQSELDSVMNYPFMNAIIAYAKGESSGVGMSQTIMTIVENYPKPVLDCLMNSLSTHDTVRILTVLGADHSTLSRDDKARHRLSESELQNGIMKQRLAAFLQYMLPGSPCMYYGDEAGLEGYEDPFNRRYFPWDSIHYELLSYYRELGAIKTSYTALRTGKITIILERDQLFGFTRKGDGVILTAITSLNDDMYEWEYRTGKVIISQNSAQTEGKVIISKHGFALVEQKTTDIRDQ